METVNVDFGYIFAPIRLETYINSDSNGGNTTFEENVSTLTFILLFSKEAVLASQKYSR